MRKKFKSEDSIERQKILEKFEAVCAMFALDLIGVKVFGYSDETAEAVASGEKLLKESGTIYESFAAMMLPEDAKRYLNFLENGSREGLTSAELAGVEMADTLLVSRKVEYEGVWDLRNAGDVLESGSKGGTDALQIGRTDLDEIWAEINIKSPGNNPLFTRHAEEALANDNVSPGVLKQLSLKYPNLRIEVTLVLCQDLVQVKMRNFSPF